MTRTAHLANHASERIPENRGTIYFDAACGMCSAAARRTQRIFGPRGFAVVPLQSDGAKEILGLDSLAIPGEIKLRTHDGRILGGADVFIELSRFVWWMFPIRIIGSLPPGLWLMKRVYAWVARRRHRISAACGLERPFISEVISVDTEITDKKVGGGKWGDYAGAMIPVAGALVVGRCLPAWGFMWLLAWAVWMACKWLTWRDEAKCSRTEVPLRVALAYFLFWPGMDARPFYHRAKPQPVALNEWIVTVLVTVLGAALIWIVTRHVAPLNMLLAGWVGMLGTVLVLHFGSFRILALLLRTRGFLVEPLMNAPTRATSLADFWGRWNRGFRDFAYRLIFRPVHRRAGLAPATLAVFFFSGLVHDLIISLPPRAGFGLPTIYFMIQGIGVLFEKSAPGRRMNSLAHRIFTYIVLLAPVGLLFHAAFVRGVFVPFLVAISAM